jgi:hypothetical protein
MDQAVTHLGTAQLHKRHSVMIEGGQVPRAKVMDQTMIDRYLMDEVLDITQFRAGELVLQQAGNACMWPKGARLDGAGGGEPGSTVPFGAIPLGNTLKLVRDRFGKFHEWLVVRVVIHNCDVRDDQSGLNKLRRSLDHIAVMKMGPGPRNPLARIRRTN